MFVLSHVESSGGSPTQHHHLTLFPFYGNLSPSPSKGTVASLRFTRSQWSLSCWAVWHPIEVLLSPEDTVQIIIGFISVGDVDFLNELTLSSCLSSPFSLSHGSLPPILSSLCPPYITLFLPPGFRAFLSSLCSCRGRGSKQQDWSYICVLVLFQTFLVNRDGECIDWGRLRVRE